MDKKADDYEKMKDQIWDDEKIDRNTKIKMIDELKSKYGNITAKDDSGKSLKGFDKISYNNKIYAKKGKELGDTTRKFGKNEISYDGKTIDMKPSEEKEPGKYRRMYLKKKKENR